MYVFALARERCWTSVTAESIQVASADAAASVSAAASAEERVASAGRECCSCCIKMLYREKECGAAGCFVTPTHIYDRADNEGHVPPRPASPIGMRGARRAKLQSGASSK